MDFLNEIEGLDDKINKVEDQLKDCHLVSCEQENGLNLRINVELENISDMLAQIKSQEEDIKGLEECRELRQEKLFEVREESKRIGRDEASWKVESKEQAEGVRGAKRARNEVLSLKMKKRSELEKGLDSLEFEQKRVSSDLVEVEQDKEEDRAFEEEVGLRQLVNLSDKQSVAKDRDLDALKADNKELLTNCILVKKSIVSQASVTTLKPDYLSWTKNRSSNKLGGYNRTPVKDQDQSTHLPFNSSVRSTYIQDRSPEYCPGQDLLRSTTDEEADILTEFKEDLNSLRVNRLQLNERLQEKIKSIESQLLN